MQSSVKLIKTLNIIILYVHYDMQASPFKKVH